MRSNYFWLFKNLKTDRLYDELSCCCKSVKITIRFDRLHWLKPVDENLQSQHKKIWNYVSKYSEFLQLEIGGIVLTVLSDIVEAFSKYRQPVHISFSSGTFSSLKECMEV
jgi:hypothetical protein